MAIDYRYTTAINRIINDAKAVEAACDWLYDLDEYIGDLDDDDQVVVLQHAAKLQINIADEISKLRDEVDFLGKLITHDALPLGYKRKYDWCASELVPIVETKTEEVKPDEAV